MYCLRAFHVAFHQVRYPLEQTKRGKLIKSRKEVDAAIFSALSLFSGEVLAPVAAAEAFPRNPNPGLPETPNDVLRLLSDPDPVKFLPAGYLLHSSDPNV